MFRKRTYAHNFLNAVFCGMNTHTIMQLRLVGAQLPHIAQQRHRVAQRTFQHVQRCAHGYRVGVVAVVDDGVGSHIHDVIPAAGGL